MRRLLVALAAVAALSAVTLAVGGADAPELPALAEGAELEGASFVGAALTLLLPRPRSRRLTLVLARADGPPRPALRESRPAPDCCGADRTAPHLSPTPGRRLRLARSDPGGDEPPAVPRS